MKEFISTIIFEKRWRYIGLSEEELRQLQNFILLNPLAGDVIQGTGGAIKLRYKLPNTGKSGGIRIIFIDFIMYEKIYLLTCYPKSKKDSLSESEKEAVKRVVKNILDMERRIFNGR